MAISLTTLTLLGQRKGNLMIPVRHILWIAAVSIAACSCDDSPASVVGIDDAGVGGAGGFFGSSQGGASKGQGGSNASQGGSNASLGGSNASQGGFSASQGGSDASQGGFNASLGGSDASQGGSSADQGGSNAFTGGTDAGPTLFAINGTVVGLEGTGLILQNNAGDNLTVLKNGAFNFATLIDSGAAYSVSVKTQPSNPAQTCTVSDGTGTISNADVTNVLVNCTTNT